MDPYNPPATNVADYKPRQRYQAEYGGIGRGIYVACYVGIQVLQFVLALIEPMLGVLVALPAYIFIGALRLKNGGYNPWTCLLFIIPIANIVVGVRCLVYPEGYADHKELDQAGKIIGGILIGLVALFVMMFIFAVATGA